MTGRQARNSMVRPVRRLRRIAQRCRDVAFLLRLVGPRRAIRILSLDRAPVFVAGCGRSGTTLLLAILAAHPRIAAIPVETDAFLHPRVTLGRRVIWERLAALDIPPQARRWAEKTPRHVRHLHRIFRAYGTAARVIIIVRDGRDVVTSVHPLAPGRYWVSPERWVDDVQAGLRWSVHPQALTIRYEDLVARPEETVRSICVFIGEAFEPAMLQFPAFARSGAQFVEYPVRDSSVGRWRKLEGDPALATLVGDRRAIALLEHFGYLEAGSRI